MSADASRSRLPTRAALLAAVCATGPVAVHAPPAAAAASPPAVRAGDTLSGIAERTGVPLATLIRLNEGVDSQSLQTGQRLKLAP